MLIHLARRKNGQRTSSVDGNGGNSGIVLNMDMVSTSYYAVAYTVPVLVGASQQNLSLQVDTGSSDLWIASNSCSSASCSATNGRLYDPDSSQSTGTTLSMQYLVGTIDGPIVWDQVQIGGYTIPNQALAAATIVDNEPLSYNFDGVLGLAPPSNSLILQIIPASSGDTPDGMTLSSNLFSLTPVADAPSQPFFSLTLARPGFSQVPSLLGIGRHPPDIIPNPSQIRYSSLVIESAGTLFWKTTVTAITVYVNGQAHPVALQSLSGAPEPTALLDSGVPLIITTPALANGIYGALGIAPASDGNYYVPCTTPLNMTITLDGQDELPLHPLDLTTEPAGQASSQYCTGLIQTDPSRLTATSGIGDMILGVPFMRNVYTVMAYEQPGATGVLNNTVAFGTDPALGLLGLTNATQAMEEFDQVRVLEQPLGSESSQQSATSQSGKPQLSIGVKILIGLVGFFMLCVALFALRYLCARRRLRPSSSLGPEEDRSPQKMGYGAYRSTRNHSQSSVEQGARLYDSLLPKNVASLYTVDSGRTRVDEDDYGFKYGVQKSKSGDTPPNDVHICDPWDPHSGTWRDTIVGTDAGEAASPRSVRFPSHDPADPRLDSPHGSPELTSALLMAHDRSDSQTSDPGEFEMQSMGMAGVGTAARGSIIDARLQHGRPSCDSVRSCTPLRPTASSLRASCTPNESVSASCDADSMF